MNVADPDVMSSPYMSSLLQSYDIPHGFGAQSWNCPRNIDCSPSMVARVACHLGLPNSRVEELQIFLPDQVHEDRIAVVGQTDTLDTISQTPADALMTSNRGEVIGVRTADCVPILISDREGRVVSAVHAGWRGLVARIIPKAIDAFVTGFHIRPDQLLAAVGPCISVRRYQVSEEVAEHFRPWPSAVRGLQDLSSVVLSGVGSVSSSDENKQKAKDIGGTQSARSDECFVDLSEVARCQLLESGVKDIDVLNLCTFDTRNGLFSYRRDADNTGRQISVVTPRRHLID